MKSAIIRLTPEVPVDMTLAYTEGKPVGRGQMMFSTVDGRVLYVPEPAGREIQRKFFALGIRAGDRVLIRQTAEYGSEGRQVSWEVYRAKVGVGVQSDGTFVVAAQPGAKEAATAVAAPGAPIRKDAPSTITSQNNSSPLAHSGLANRLRDETNMLVAVLASCRSYARSTHGELIADDDVCSLLAAVYARERK